MCIYSQTDDLALREMIAPVSEGDKLVACLVPSAYYAENVCNRQKTLLHLAFGAERAESLLRTAKKIKLSVIFGLLAVVSITAFNLIMHGALDKEFSYLCLSGILSPAWYYVRYDTGMWLETAFQYEVMLPTGPLLIADYALCNLCRWDTRVIAIQCYTFSTFLGVWGDCSPTSCNHKYLKKLQEGRGLLKAGGNLLLLLFAQILYLITIIGLIYGISFSTLPDIAPPFEGQDEILVSSKQVPISYASMFLAAMITSLVLNAKILVAAVKRPNCLCFSRVPLLRVCESEQSLSFGSHVSRGGVQDNTLSEIETLSRRNESRKIILEPEAFFMTHLGKSENLMGAPLFSFRSFPSWVFVASTFAWVGSSALCIVSLSFKEPHSALSFSCLMGFGTPILSFIYFDKILLKLCIRQFEARIPAALAVAATVLWMDMVRWDERCIPLLFTLLSTLIVIFYDCSGHLCNPAYIMKVQNARYGFVRILILQIVIINAILIFLCVALRYDHLPHLRVRRYETPHLVLTSASLALMLMGTVIVVLLRLLYVSITSPLCLFLNRKYVRKMSIPESQLNKETGDMTPNSPYVSMVRRRSTTISSFSPLRTPVAKTSRRLCSATSSHGSSDTGEPATS